MLVIKNDLGYQKIYNKKTKSFVNVKYVGKDEDAYGSRVLEEDGKVLKADVRKNEKLLIVNFGFKQKAIALVEAKNKADLLGNDVNDLLKNPNNHVYFFNLDGEYIVDVQGYKSTGDHDHVFNSLMDVEFTALCSQDELILRRDLTVLGEDNKPHTRIDVYNYSYSKNAEAELTK